MEVTDKDIIRSQEKQISIFSGKIESQRIVIKDLTDRLDAAMMGKKTTLNVALDNIVSALEDINDSIQKKDR